jgi:hypothetical protein
MAHHKHYVRDRGMAGLGWVGHVGLGQDEDYYGTDDAGNDIYVSTTSGGFVDENGMPVSPVGSISGDTPLPSGVMGPPVAMGPAAPVAPVASSGTGQTYYGTDSKGNDIWVNGQGKFVNQDGLPVTPAAGTLQVEGGGSVTVPAGASSTAGLTAGLKIASGTLPALLAPGPAPRVTVPAVATSSITSLLTGSSIIPGVSNLVILGGGLLAVVLLAGKK